MMRFSKKGLSLVELLVGLIVTAIVVMMVAAIGAFAKKSYVAVLNNADVTNDSQFAVQLIREAVRESTGAPTKSSAGSSTCLIIPEAPGSCPITTYEFFYNVGTSNLFWGTSCSIPSPCSSTKGIIFGATGLVFTPDISALPLVSVILSGTESNNAFSYSINATRRNP